MQMHSPPELQLSQSQMMRKRTPPQEAEAKQAKRAKAQVAANLRVGKAAADAAALKKQRVGDASDINVDLPGDDL